MPNQSSAPSTDATPVLVFDGDCGFCTTSARAAQRWLRLERVEPWQFLDLEALRLTTDACTTSVQWVGSDGTVRAGEDAIAGALRHAGGAWRVLARVIDLPGVHWLAGVAYRWVARNRYHLPGGTAACRRPHS